MASKIRERSFADLVCRHANLDLIRMVDRESPDFELVFSDGRVVGLEIQQAVDRKRKEGQLAMDRLCHDLRDELHRLGLRFRVVPSFFGACSELVGPKAQRRQHVSAIVTLIQSKMCDEIDVIKVDQKDLTEAGAPYLHQLNVRRWHETIVGWGHGGPGEGFVFLDERIRHKDRLLDRYRVELPTATEFWLALVNGGEKGCSIWNEIAAEHTYPTRFDRVFFVDLEEHRCFDMQIEKRS